MTAGKTWAATGATAAMLAGGLLLGAPAAVAAPGDPACLQATAQLDAALAGAGLPPERIDRVFLTGGTSLVPAVRRLFEDRFGPAKLAGGGEFVSVAEGLALMGAAPD